MTQNSSQLSSHNPELLIQLIQRAPLAETTKRKYTRAVERALAAEVNLLDSQQVGAYAATLKHSPRSHLKSVIKLWSKAIELQAKGRATPANVGAVQAIVYRTEALNESITVTPPKGEKPHIWLSKAQVANLYLFCSGNAMKDFRNRVVLALLVGTGLRREELVNLQFDDLLQQPLGTTFRTVLSIQGKGAKQRTIPIHPQLAKLIGGWQARVGGTYIARSVNKGGKVGNSLSVIGLFKIVAAAGASIGLPELAPHDLRRTFGQLGYEAGIPLTQISKLYGHSSVAVTQRYLNLDLNLKETVSDYIPMPI